MCFFSSESMFLFLFKKNNFQQFQHFVWLQMMSKVNLLKLLVSIGWIRLWWRKCVWVVRDVNVKRNWNWKFFVKKIIGGFSLEKKNDKNVVCEEILLKWCNWWCKWKSNCKVFCKVFMLIWTRKILPFCFCNL